MGDLNISPTDLDIGIGEDNRKRWLRTGKCSFLPEEREWLERLQNWGLVDTFRAANPDCNDHFHGLITVPVVLMKTEAFASIYCWPVNHWRLVVLLQVLIMQSVGWKTIRPRAGLVRILTLMSAPCLNTGPPLKRIKHIYPSLGKFIHNQVNTK